jgi:hypothetical protein
MVDRVLSRHISDVLSQVSRNASTIIFGHSDADGHLATEQSRSNALSAGLSVNKVVVSHDTASYRFWERFFRHYDFSEFELVITIDLAFSFRTPEVSLNCLLSFVDSNPNKQFLVIDHHPLASPAVVRNNLHLISVDAAYNCCFGEAGEELMRLAAICEGERLPGPGDVSQAKRALGVKRASADVGGVSGNVLLALLASRDWGALEALADESSVLHRNIRGRRAANSLESRVLRDLATGLL